MKSLCSTPCLLAAILGFSVPALAAPPENDAFANRILLSSSAPVSTTGTNVEATKEIGEPSHAGNGGGKSVWWRWTAPYSGPFAIKTVGSSYDTTLGVYTGSAVNALSLVAGDDDTGGGGTSLLTISATVGTVYQIAVDGWSGASGSIVLAIEAGPTPPTPPANDSFSNRITLPSGDVTISGTNQGATKEAGEPLHAGNPGGKSVWWSWTAPSTGECQIEVLNSPFFPLIGIYTGSDVNALTSAGSTSGGSFASFNAVSGVTYHVAVDTGSSGTGSFTLHISNPIPPPANDSFAARIVLGGMSAKATGYNNGATKEAGEPLHAGNLGGKSVWYSWTAPSSGSFSAYLKASVPLYIPILAIYTGTDVGALTPVGSGTFSNPLAVSFTATGGVTYQFAVDGASFGGAAHSGNFLFNVSQVPANDAFAAAIDLGSASSGVSSSWIDLGTGTEPGEPDAPPFIGQSGPRTIWWKWTAPANAFFSFDTLTSDFDTTLQVFTGSAVHSLALVAENGDADSAGRSRVTLQGSAGTVYYIRVSGDSPDDIGLVALQFSQLATPASAADHVRLGRAHLELHSAAALAQADAQFQSALALDANHAEANFLKALTLFATLEQGTAFQTALSGLGIVKGDLYQGGYSIPKDGNGDMIPTPGTHTSSGIDYLINTVLPVLTTIRTHLDKASSPAFATSLSDSESAASYVEIDAGDVLGIRAATHALEAIIRLLQTYDAGVSVADLITENNQATLTAESLFDSVTNLLELTGNDQRTAFKTAVQNANTHYQAGSDFVRNTRSNSADDKHLLYLPADYAVTEADARARSQEVSDSFNGATTVAGETIDLSAAVTSPQSLREQLPSLLGDKGVASTTPDPTLAGVAPTFNQTKVNNSLRKHGLLYEVSTFGNWTSHFLKNQAPADQAKTADPDHDMLSNFAEFAFNLDPSRNSGPNEYAVSGLETNISDGKKYLNLSYVRRIDRATLNYVIAVSDNLSTWDRTQAQVVQVGAATPNADGITETVKFRVLADPAITGHKFVRVEVTDGMAP
jgi:hypothetical protein